MMCTLIYFVRGVDEKSENLELALITEQVNNKPFSPKCTSVARGFWGNKVFPHKKFGIFTFFGHCQKFSRASLYSQVHFWTKSSVY